jgi:Protein of unknown function (DUF3822)
MNISNNVIYNNLPAQTDGKTYHIILQLQKQSVTVVLVQTFDNLIAFQGFYPANSATISPAFLDGILLPLKKYTLDKAFIGLDDKRTMLVPLEMIDDNNNKILLSQLHLIDANEIVLSETIAWQNYASLFVLKQATMQLLQSYFTNVHIVNTASACLTEFNRLKKNETKFNFYVSICTNYFVLTIYKGSILQVHNTFDFENEIDILYQITKATEIYNCPQANIYTNGFKIYEINELLNNHFTNLACCPSPSGLMYNNKVEPGHQQLFYQIYTLAKQCVS